jgi:predicted ATP-grasp superfamily ATP-dependent carboligase
MKQRRPLIVYIDAIGVATAETIADAAARRRLATAVVCPPGALGAQAGRIARIIETNDFSMANLRRLLARLDRDYRIRGLYSMFGPYRADGFLHGAVATLAAERGLAHSPPLALAAATNKFFARYCLGTAGVPDVPFGVASDETSLLAIARRIGYPIVLKPLTGVGSSLIFRCGDDAEARRLWRKAMQQLPGAHYEQLRMSPHAIATAQGAVFFFDPSRSMLVERYLPGREASVECLVADDRVIPLVVHDKLDVEEITGSVLEHLLVVPPLRFTRSEVRRLRSHAAASVRALGLRNTFCHVELRWVDGLGPRILEINPRIGAGCIADSIETFTNLRVDDARVALILGERLPRVKMRAAPRHAMVFLYTPRSGTITALDGLEDVNEWDGVNAVRVMGEIGERLGGDTEEGFVASIFLEARNEREARRACAHIQKRVRIEVA